jgi:hypothetical protein
MKQWFDINKEGLKRVLERRGKEFAVFELVQNAWDEPGVTQVAVSLLPDKTRSYYWLKVEDDAPDGFKNLKHAYTLFDDSAKKANAEQRGRFNFGEKLVLALAKEPTVVSTTGGIRFSESGRHRMRTKRSRGSAVEILIPLSKEERDRILSLSRRLIPPTGVATTINGEPLQPGDAVDEFEAVLPTEIANADGNLVSKKRRTKVRVYAATPEAPSAIYEMGIPVVNIDGRYIFDVGQKIPVTLDRENVRDGFSVSMSCDLGMSGSTSKRIKLGSMIC